LKYVLSDMDKLYEFVVVACKILEIVASLIKMARPS